jgi:hypothetical protein
MDDLVGCQDHLPNMRYLCFLYRRCSGKDEVQKYVDLCRLPLVRRACAGWGVPITAVSNVKETERKHTGALFHLDEPV